MSQTNNAKYGPVSLWELTKRGVFYKAEKLDAQYPNGYGMRFSYTGFSEGSYYYVPCYGVKGPTGSGATGMGDTSLREIGQTVSYDYPICFTCSPNLRSQVSSHSASATYHSYHSYDGAGSGTKSYRSTGGGCSLTAKAGTSGNPGAQYASGWFYAHPELNQVTHIHKQHYNAGNVSGAKVGYEMIAYASGYLAGSAQQLIDEFDSNTSRTITKTADLPSSKRYIVSAVCAWSPGNGNSSWNFSNWQVGQRG